MVMRAEVAALSVRCIADGHVDPSAVGVLADVDAMALEAEDRVELIRAWERVKAMVDAMQQEALASVIEATEGVGLDGDLARHEVGAALRLSPLTASRRTRNAADLVRRLPATLAQLRAGRISYLQASHLAEAVRELPDDLATQVETRVLAKAWDQTLAETKRLTKRAVIAADRLSAMDRFRKAVEERTIDRMPLADSMEAFWVSMPATVADEVWTALTDRARAEQSARQDAGLDDPGMDALRVDALVAAVLGEHGGTQQSSAIPKCRCGGAQVAAIVVDLATVLGMADNPGEIPGYGAIPGPLAREMASNRDWVRWTIDPGSRQVIDRGADTYRPSDRMKAFLAARDRVCGFAGCNRPAQACDCDHVVTFRRHGRTITVNLGPLCRQHHNAKTHGGWRLHYNAETGTKTWTSPLGRRYAKGTDPPLA